MHTWIFDVDGVILSPKTRFVELPQIITQIAKRLERHDNVALITGRSIFTLEERVLPLLEKEISDKTLLQNLYVTGEFGGVYTSYENGVRQKHIHKESVLPAEFLQQLKDATDPFLDCVYVENKQAIFSVESLPDKIELFRQKREDMIATYQKIVETNNMQEIAEVLPDRIAVNVRSIHANKYRSTEQYLCWLEEKQETPNQITIFGDTYSDLEMGQAVSAHHIPVVFVYTGKQDELHNKTDTFPVIFTKKLCDKGTLEYLTEHLS